MKSGSDRMTKTIKQICKTILNKKIRELERFIEFVQSKHLKHENASSYFALVFIIVTLYRR